MNSSHVILQIKCGTHCGDSILCLEAKRMYSFVDFSSIYLYKEIWEWSLSSGDEGFAMCTLFSGGLWAQGRARRSHSPKGLPFTWCLRMRVGKFLGRITSGVDWFIETIRSCGFYKKSIWFDDYSVVSSHETDALDNRTKEGSWSAYSFIERTSSWRLAWQLGGCMIACSTTP